MDGQLLVRWTASLCFALGAVTNCRALKAYELTFLDRAAELSQPIESIHFWNGSFAETFRSEYLSKPPQLLAGTEFSFLDVNASSGGQVTLSLNDADTAGVDASFIDGNGVHDDGVAARMWVGVQIFDRWSVIGRYWSLSESVSRPPDLAPGTTPLPNFATFSDDSTLEAFTADVEVVRSLRLGQWKLDGMVGGRRAVLDVDSKLTAFGVFTTGNFINLALSNGSSFDGTGVTYGLAARRRILGSHTHLFLSARGSRIHGENNSFGRSVGTVTSPPSSPLAGAATVRRIAPAELDIFEYQIGAEWNYGLKRFPASVFLRAAYEFQEWDIAGPLTGGAGFGGTLGDLTTNSFSSAGIGDLELRGFSFSTGLTW